MIDYWGVPSLAWANFEQAFLIKGDILKEHFTDIYGNGVITREQCIHL